jgi:hypothetical protein
MGRLLVYNLLFVLLAMALLSSATHAAPPAYYVKLTLSPEGRPLAYAEIRGNELRVASTIEGLAEATSVRASDSGVSRDGGTTYQHATFPSVDLPVRIPEMTKVSGTFSLWRAVSRSRRSTTDHLSVGAEISLSKRAQSGVLLTYVFGSYADAAAAKGPSQAAHIAIPRVEKLRLELETQVKGREARVGFRVKAGDVALRQVLRDGKPAVCTLEIADRQGSRIHASKGDLDKFGFT